MWVKYRWIYSEGPGEWHGPLEFSSGYNVDEVMRGIEVSDGPKYGTHWSSFEWVKITVDEAAQMRVAPVPSHPVSSHPAPARSRSSAKLASKATATLDIPHRALEEALGVVAYATQMALVKSGKESAQFRIQLDDIVYKLIAVAEAREEGEDCQEYVAALENVVRETAFMWYGSAVRYRMCRVCERYARTEAEVNHQEWCPVDRVVPRVLRGESDGE